MESDLAAKLTEKLAWLEAGAGEGGTRVCFLKNLPGARFGELLWCCAGLESWAHRASGGLVTGKPAAGHENSNMVPRVDGAPVAARVCLVLL